MDWSAKTGSPPLAGTTASLTIGFGSPARKFIPLGESIGQGLTVGLDRSADGFVRRLASLVAPRPGGPGGAQQGANGSDDHVSMLREIRDLLAALRLTVTPEGLALAVRQGERKIRYT